MSDLSRLFGDPEPREKPIGEYTDAELMEVFKERKRSRAGRLKFAIGCVLDDICRLEAEVDRKRAHLEQYERELDAIEGRPRLLEHKV
jgi:hypothetical protein